MHTANHFLFVIFSSYINLRNSFYIPDLDLFECYTMCLDHADFRNISNKQKLLYNAKINIPVCFINPFNSRFHNIFFSILLRNDVPSM
jgi:hypothetical protein